MSQPAVRITQADGRGTVHVDGHDIAHVVYGATIRMSAGEPPQVDLELLPAAVHVDVDAAQIVIDDQTRAVLERLGWTPPQPATACGHPADRHCIDCATDPELLASIWPLPGGGA